MGDSKERTKNGTRTEEEDDTEDGTEDDKDGEEVGETDTKRKKQAIKALWEKVSEGIIKIGTEYRKTNRNNETQMLWEEKTGQEGEKMRRTNTKSYKTH